MTVTGVTMKKLREDVKIQRNQVSHSPQLHSTLFALLLDCLIACLIIFQSSD